MPFQPRCSTSVDTPTANTEFQFPESSYTYESNFEHDFCKWFLQEFPDARKQEGSTPEDKVQEYICMCNSQGSGLDSIMEGVYDYIKGLRITHYISAIELGACKYSLTLSKTRCQIQRMKHEIGQEYLAGLGVGIENKTSRTDQTSKVLCIGDIDSVNTTGEAMTRYNLLPLFTLVCREHKEIKKILQMAICYYLKKSSKCVYLMCVIANT